MPDQPATGETVSFGFKTVPEAARQGLVNEVFSSVASRYDLMNDLMSGGLHRLWKSDFVGVLAPPRSARPFLLLDVAGGTGDITLKALRTGGPGTQVTLLDISPEMVEVGRKRVADAALSDRVTFTIGNAEALPFADKSFDAYTIAFGIRNVTHIDRALAEAYRVLKTGGRFLCLEFSACEVPLLDRLYDLHSFQVIPRLGQLTAGDGDSYRYLVESIRKFPRQERFAEMIRAAGFSRVSYRNLTGGIAAIHSGWRT
ncbi:MAG TPA: bifunctional demethylmenaquinone methyltransferase/2-methoxy-6-polyprenyl-1,4-benzoquinol methylase UbiE [Hyphomicrobiaceae bacterium]|nr:bifunctional demethylmenaquinone methyltransferase/2-methoxy-6-polyprenyl-1,4-benzoquinol methylase UbiE [Hyphomicrobiaceae bacterium]